MKIVKQTSNTVTNFETGEVTSVSQTNVIQFPQEPPFIKMYIQDLCNIVGVGDSDQALLRHLLVRLDYEGFVVLTARSRTSIASALGIGLQTLKNRLTRLTAADLIKSVSRNEYRVNPNFFARGDWKRICEQRESYRMTITYSAEGREVTTSAVGGDHHAQTDMWA